MFIESMASLLFGGLLGSAFDDTLEVAELLPSKNSFSLLVIEMFLSLLLPIGLDNLDNSLSLLVELLRDSEFEFDVDGLDWCSRESLESIKERVALTGCLTDVLG